MPFFNAAAILKVVALLLFIPRVTAGLFDLELCLHARPTIQSRGWITFGLEGPFFSEALRTEPIPARPAG